MIELGLSQREFHDRFFEKQPRHFPGALRERPFTWSTLDRLLYVLDPTAPTTRMFHQGQLPDNAYMDEFVELGKPRRKLNKAKFYEYLQRGATLQINWLERHSVEAKRLCMEIGRFVGTQTSGNAYLSFSGDGTFGKHWDTHDVFAIQLIGRKRWRIYAPTFPLPLAHQSHDRSGHRCPDEPVLEITMEEGDVFYLPRGWWHHVIPLQCGSFHFSVGCYAPTLFDYIVQTSAKYLELQVAARRSFSVTDYRETVSALLDDLKIVLSNEANGAAFDHDFVVRERMSAEYNLAVLDSPAFELPDTARVSLATFRVPKLEDGALIVNGVRVTLDDQSRAVVAALSTDHALSLAELRKRISEPSPEAMRKTVLDLARHDIVSIQT